MALLGLRKQELSSTYPTLSNRFRDEFFYHQVFTEQRRRFGKDGRTVSYISNPIQEFSTDSALWDHTDHTVSMEEEVSQ